MGSFSVVSSDQISRTDFVRAQLQQMRIAGEVYNVGGWVSQLHLQQCVFVGTGQNLFAIFLETRPRQYEEDRTIRDYFIGLCDVDTIRRWKLCPANVEKNRAKDCSFSLAGSSSARVHRRLCDLSELAYFGNKCNCNATIRGRRLNYVVGFPTCYLPPLPGTLCGQNNVCGVNKCKTKLVADRIYSVRCDPHCYGGQPFCEMPDWETAKPREITSFWTDWSEPFCTDGDCRSQYTEANCINKNTGAGDVDCLGPGTSCCPADLENCKCHVFSEEGAARVIRTFTLPKIPEYEDLPIEDLINKLPFNKNIILRAEVKHEDLPQIERIVRNRHDDRRYWERDEKRKAESEATDEDDDDLPTEKNIDIDEADEEDEDELKEDDEEDIAIEEDEDDEPTSTTESMEKEEIAAILKFQKEHKNETIVDVPDINRNSTPDVSTVCDY